MTTNNYDTHLQIIVAQQRLLQQLSAPTLPCFQHLPKIVNVIAEQVQKNTLFEFLSEEDKECFIEWGTIVLKIDHHQNLHFLIATFKRYKVTRHNIRLYRIFGTTEERLVVPFDEYELKLKQNLRESQIDSILVS